jgi:hypothetical protein
VTTEAEIIDRFAYHPATPESARLHDEVRRRATEFAVWLNDNLPGSRETSLALTSCQETMMWANASIAIHGAPVATEEQRTTPQPSHGQGHMHCSGCDTDVPMNHKSVNGSMNPHWDGDRYTCQEA